MPRYPSDEEMADLEATRDASGEEEEGEEEEYEIEQIIDAKSNAFKGKMGYLVKWKGYGVGENSWVSEEDAQGAADLIKEYWEKQKQGPRKPTARKSLPAEAREASPEVEAVPAKKRGRTSVSKPISVSDDDDEQSDRPQPKKSKNTATSASVTKSKSASMTKSSAQKPKKRAPSPSDSDEETFSDMRKWKLATSWEHIVKRVDTVERTDDGKLLVYFTLNERGLTKVEHAQCREESALCKEKFPKAMLDFYERNLRWRNLEDEDKED
ncbi:hypothetical protein EUX98_g6441 [Antrodiella citrinella]|uniref:Chromo domain-containing protein n=1 Tax=Antrodiella citrinella TaxID=2447956 RepID=A0A4S4MPA2_9APHY|nr:hypothetical protein EUX98_g6441 [Antrodiella citrinella]